MSAGPINLVCPRCSSFIPNNEQPGAYPGALSRYDADIELCSRCGGEEAVLQFMAMQSEGKPYAAIHPVTGRRPWDNPPGI